MTFTDQHVAVFGSAPGVIAPKVFDTTLFANEAPCIAPLLRVPVDHTVLSGFILNRDDPNDRRHLRLLFGLNLGHVYVLEDFGPAAVVSDGLRRHGVDFSGIEPLTPYAWASCVERVTGAPLGRQLIDGSHPEHSVSTGVFCACLAFDRGASDVTLCGISLQPGYAHTRVPDVRRGHLEGDIAALHALHDRYPLQLFTTSSELSKMFGIRQV